MSLADQTQFYATGAIRKRASNRIAGTNFVNELVDSINNSKPPTTTGADSSNAWASEFDAIITAWSQESPDFAWAYTVRPISKGSPGRGNWTETGGDINMVVYNRCEDINGSTGLTGCGINIDNLPPGFTLQPIPIGTPVRCIQETCVGGVIEYWFSQANQVDGVCESSEGDGGGA